MNRTTRHRTLVVLATLALLLGVVAVGPAAGDTEPRAPIDNDNWAGYAIPALPYVDNMVTTAKGLELNEPVPGCATGAAHSRSVWYSYVVPANTNLTVATTGSNYDTVVAVYTGATLATLTQVACQDNAGATEQFAFAATPGTYFFQVSHSAAAGTGGNLLFQLHVTGAAMDTFPGTAIGALPYQTISSTVGFTKEALEPNPCGVGTHGQSAWFSYTPAANMTITADTFGSGYNTVLAVYTGNAVNALTPVPLACNDNAGGTLQSQVTFAATAGVTYRFQVSDALGAGGGTLDFYVAGAGWDDYYQPLVIPGVPYTHTGDTTAATLQAGEPVPTCVAAHDNSVWYRYTATTTQTLTADTRGSTYDTVLQIYTTSWATPMANGCNDDISATDLDSEVTFTAYQGVTYYFQVSSWLNPSAGGTLVFRLGGGAQWDDYYQPLVINTLPYTHAGNTTGMTLQAGEPTPACVNGHNRSVWYKYTPTVDTPVRADTRGSTYDTVIQVYRGTWNTRVTCNDDISATDLDSEVMFTALANNTYYFQVSATGTNAVGGNLAFHVYAGPEPPWDEYANPFEFDDLPFSDLDVDTTMATLQTGEPVPSCVTGHSNSVWYAFTPTRDWAVTADTAGSKYDTVLAVYRTTWNTPIACDDNGGSLTSEVAFTAEAGETYLFQISSKGAASDGGILDFHVSGIPLPQYCRGVEATIVGTEGPDVIYGTEGADVIVALGGNDLIFGLGGDDLICAGPGNDRVFAGDGDDRVFGQLGNDILHGGAGNDRLYGWAGDDVLLGKNGDDILRGGLGDDGLYGGPGHDDARGGPGDDTVYGGPGDDILFGNAGYDILRGGPGNDWCYCGEDVIC